MENENKNLGYGNYVSLQGQKNKTENSAKPVQTEQKTAAQKISASPTKPIQNAQHTNNEHSQKIPDAAAKTATDSAPVLDKSTNLLSGNDFVLEEPKSAPRRSDEIAKFLSDEKANLKIEKDAIRLYEKFEKKEKKQIELETKIRHPIGEKLVIIISFLLALAVGSVTYVVSYFVTSDMRSNAEENNLAMNARTTADTESRINNAVSSVNMFLDLISTESSNENGIQKIESMFFKRNREIAAIFFSKDSKTFMFANETFIAANEIPKENVLAYMSQESETAEKAKKGSFEMLNASPFFNVPLIAIFCPAGSVSTSASSAAQNDDSFVAFLYSTAGISENYAVGSINQSFLVNNDGITLIHSDIEKMNAATDLSESKIVKEMLSSKSNNGQINYKDETDEEYIGAFRRLGLGNGGVITVVKTAIVLEGIKRITIRNIYIMFAVIALAILIIYFFAKSLSLPLGQLTEVVNEVNKGNFNTKLFDRLKDKRRDEIGILERSTKNERDILNLVSRLTNKGVTKAVITKKIDFNPHLKDITIFFSDIRGFTAISDGFKKRFGEHSTCINKTGGIVDKFEGDAIMAAWGVLRNETLDWEKLKENSVTKILKEEAHAQYVKEDALSAITCCIAMRYSLMKYNKDAEAFTAAHRNDPLAKYKPHIRIGAGLNSGRATVGFMGSFDKMEFTSIGDAVNFASRAEASNKPCGTDILITQDTYDILKKDYIRCKENNFIIRPQNVLNEIIVEKIPVEFEVKGKGKQHFYGVVNMPNFDVEAFFKSEDEEFTIDPDCDKAVGPAGPKTLKELRELLGIETPDFEKVNLDAEENKIQVANP